MAYTSQHTLIEALVNAMLAVQPCTEINLVQSPAYVIDGNQGGGAWWRVECVTPAVAGGNPYAGYVLTFDPPTARTDGTLLECGEVTQYKIDFDKRCVYAISAAGESVGECY